MILHCPELEWHVFECDARCFLDPAASSAYGELRRPPVPWPGLASTVPIQFIPQTISGRGLHRG
jgi:hypothetical protein